MNFITNSIFISLSQLHGIEESEKSFYVMIFELHIVFGSLDMILSFCTILPFLC